MEEGEKAAWLPGKLVTVDCTVRRTHVNGQGMEAVEAEIGGYCTNVVHDSPVE